MDAATAAVMKIDTSKTKDCVFITTHFHMGIGRMRQIRDLEVTTTADKSLLRHQKKLIESPELDEIRSQDGYLTRHLASRSATYDKSTRFIHKSEAEKMYRACVAYQSIRRPKLVADFMKKYRELEALDFAPLKDALGDKFDRGDYPSSDAVEAGFYFEFNLRPVGDINLVGLPDFIIKEELAKDAKKREQAVEEWLATLRLAGLEVIDALFDACKPQPDGKKRKLYDSTVGNIADFLSTFSIRDLAGDSEYQTKVIAPLKKLMAGVTMEKIRHSDNLKGYIATQVGEIRKTAQVLVQATGRKFR